MLNISEARVIGTLIEIDNPPSRATVETNIDGRQRRHLVVIRDFRQPEYGRAPEIGCLVEVSGSIGVSADGILEISVEPFSGSFKFLAPAPALNEGHDDRPSLPPAAEPLKSAPAPAPTPSASVSQVAKPEPERKSTPNSGMPSFGAPALVTQKAPSSAAAPEKATAESNPEPAKPAADPSPAPAAKAPAAPSFAVGFAPPPSLRPSPAPAPKKPSSGGLKRLQGSGRPASSHEVAPNTASDDRQNEPMGPDVLDSHIPF